jgi:hypothetical protein
MARAALSPACPTQVGYRLLVSAAQPGFDQMVVQLDTSTRFMDPYM